MRIISKIKNMLKMKYCKHEYVWKADYLVMYERCKKCGKIKL